MPYFRILPLSRGWQLRCHEDAHAVAHRDGNATVVLVGAAARDDRLGPAIATEDLRKLVAHPEPYLDHIAGMYTLVVDDGDNIRVYTDPAGMATVYFSDGCVASTPSLLQPLLRDDSVDRQYKIKGSDNWYTGSVTPFRGVRYLMANHVLHLETGNVRRFWPRDGDPSEVEGDVGVAAIASFITNGIANLAGAHKVLLSLTGGRDSRVNLACAARLGLGLQSFTIRSNAMSGSEARVVEQLVAITGMPHTFLLQTATPAWLMGAYDEMTASMSTGARREVAGACAALADRNLVHLNGNLGALFLAFYWPKATPRHVHVSDLAREFVQRPPVILEGLREWLSSVPVMSAGSTLNLMYLEQRGGRWMGVGERASQLFYDSYTPFCSRSVFRTLCMLPEACQRNGHTLVRLVELLCPPLAGLPYCSGTNLAARVLPKAIKVLVKRLIGRE